MYDNIDMVLFKNNIGSQLNLLEYVPQFLEKTNESYFSDSNSIVVVGYINSLKVIVSQNAVKIKDSSLCKWFLGDNIQTLTRGDTERAIEKISDTIHLPMYKADVRGLDVATNFIMNYDASVYYEYLGNLQYFNRAILGSGLYYQGANGKLIFYDKIKDAKFKKMNVPELFNNKNLLRYERRFEKRLCKQLNRSELKVSELYDEKFYTQMIDKWVQDYESINRIRNIHKTDYSMIKTKTDLYNQALLFYIESQGGLVNILHEQKQAQKMGLLTRKQAQDLRNKCKEVATHKRFTSENDLIKELDQNIKRVQKYYR